MNSPSNLMNFPDAFGQFYHPTPTPAAMANNHYGHISTSSPGNLQASTNHNWQDSSNYYHEDQKQDDSAGSDDQLQSLDQYYYYDDTSRYSHRNGPMYEYYDYDVDQRIRDIDKNEAIFRQDGDWLGNMGSLFATALQIVSLVAGLLSGDSAPSSTSTVDRVDTSAAASVASAAGSNDLDYAMGTLMAYGGKYLREMALWAWEYGTQTPAESIGQTIASGTSSSDSNSQPTSSLASVVSSASQPSKPYLSTLSQAELEKIGLKAVAAGANPQTLQQAFATAQLQGDWTKLEKEISKVLGIEAINPPELALAASAQATISQLVSSATGGGLPGPGAGGDSGIVAQASNLIDRIQKVISPPPVPLKPNGDPVNSADFIKNQNIVTRFVTEFGLEQEMLQFQNGVNKVIIQVNNFLGEETPNQPQQPVDRIGVQATEAQQPATGGQDSIVSLLTSIPQAIGAAAVAAIKFITPSSAGSNPTQIQNKVGRPSETTYSEVKPFIDLNQVAFGVLGVAALGTVGYGVYAANSNSKAKTANRRKIYYKRSADESAQDLDRVWMKVAQSLLKGWLELDNEPCQLEYDRCMKLNYVSKARMGSDAKKSEMWVEKCLQRKRQCEKMKTSQ